MMLATLDDIWMHFLRVGVFPQNWQAVQDMSALQSLRLRDCCLIHTHSKVLECSLNNKQSAIFWQRVLQYKHAGPCD